MTPKEVELDLERIVAEFEEFIAAYPDLAESVSDLIALLALVREQREQLATKDAEIERLVAECGFKDWEIQRLNKQTYRMGADLQQQVLMKDYHSGTRDSSGDTRTDKGVEEGGARCLS